jgi:hypothetical protein
VKLEPHIECTDLVNVLEEKPQIIHQGLRYGTGWGKIIQLYSACIPLTLYKSDEVCHSVTCDRLVVFYKFWGVPNVRLQFNYGNVNDICGDQQPWSFTSARIMPRLGFMWVYGV